MTTTGELNRCIILQYPTVSRSSSGAPVTVYNDGATVWAKRTTHRSDEAVKAMAETGTATHNYRIRYRTDVKGSWKVKDGNAVMAIIGPPMEVGRREWLDITVREAK